MPIHYMTITFYQFPLIFFCGNGTIYIYICIYIYMSTTLYIFGFKKKLDGHCKSLIRSATNVIPLELPPVI